MKQDFAWGKLPLYFIANQGQLDERVAYYVQGSDKTLYFAPDGVTFVLTSPSSPLLPGEDHRNKVSRRWNVKLDFVGANIVRPIGQAQTEAIISYFKGARDEWHTGLPTYSRIVYPGLWEGIDLVYSGTVDRLKYTLVVQPGSDPTHIRLAYRGATVGVTDAGQLEVSTPAGGFQDEAPTAYQEIDGQRVPVTVQYALDDAATSGAIEPRLYGFYVGDYDPALPLVIDPAVLVYCGFLGGSGREIGHGIAVDAAGNAYVTGETRSAEATFPVTAGPDLAFNGGQDAFVAKVKADGTGLVYAGYIGGSYLWEYGYGIAVDNAGSAYITGETDTADGTFPVTVGPNLTYNGSVDAFVAKVNVNGTGLDYCGYIGGSCRDVGYGIAVDTAHNAYIVGKTCSTQTTFPVKDGPDLTFNGGNDAFVAKVRADGTGLVYAGYIGGSGNEEGYAIAMDATGYAYVTGPSNTSNGSFPATIGPDLTHNGLDDVFMAKVKADGKGLVYAGFIGGSGQDAGYGIAVDGWGAAYITGHARSSEANFPTTSGPDLTYNGGLHDAFVAKVNPGGTALVYAGYIGGVGDDWGYGIAVEAAGTAYVTGYTESTEATFPVTVGPDLTHNGSYDAFIAKVKLDGTGLDYAGYIGGQGAEDGRGIALDSSGNVYITGFSGSNNGSFPVIGGPDLTHNGDLDAFVAKISGAILDHKVHLPQIVR